MKRQATTAELVYAERWLKARAVALDAEGPNEIHPKPIWFFPELPDTVRVLLDMNYANGDEAFFNSREAAMHALAVTLAECLDAARLPINANGDTPCSER